VVTILTRCGLLIAVRMVVLLARRGRSFFDLRIDDGHTAAHYGGRYETQAARRPGSHFSECDCRASVSRWLRNDQYESLADRAHRSIEGVGPAACMGTPDAGRVHCSTHMRCRTVESVRRGRLHSRKPQTPSGSYDVNSTTEPRPGHPYQIVVGDTISRIAFRAFGDARRYKEICEYNRAVIGPNAATLIEGVVLQIPNLDYLSAPRSLFGRGTVGKTFAPAESLPKRS
jgi:hypothetical protein